MARLESVALGGFYAFPNECIPYVASLINVLPTFESKKGYYGATQFGNYPVLDPCAGESEAVIALTKKLWGQDLSKVGPNVSLLTIEMERLRYEKGKKLLTENFNNNYDRYSKCKALNADAFTVNFETDTYRNRGAALLWLNPPYDTHKIHGRLEQKFLERFTTALVPGSGILCYIVPFYAIAASAEFLDTHYEGISCWKLPDPYFEDNFKQVVLMGVKREVPATFRNERVIKQIQTWAGDDTTIPVITSQKKHLYTLPAQLETNGFSSFEKLILDVEELKHNVRPFMAGGGSKKRANKGRKNNTGTGNSLHKTLKKAREKAQDFWDGLAAIKEVGLHLGLKEFVGRPYQVAMPPKMAHIAMALASGIFNGQEIMPDDPEGNFPPIIIKGTFEKEYVTVEEKTNSKGEKKSEIRIQQPVLNVNVRDMRTYKSYDLAPGSEPTGTISLENFNTADLIQHYGMSLTGLMLKQFPALHDPFNPQHQLDLPLLGRKPYKSQWQIIQAAVKQLYLVGDVIIMGEVGTGKSTMALYVVGLLNQENFTNTVDKLKAVGLDKEAASNVQVTGKTLKPLERPLVLCPPHLLKSWTDQVGFSLPGAKVIVLREITDLNRPTARELVDFEILHPEKYLDHPRIFNTDYYNYMKPRAIAYRKHSGQPGYGMTVYVMSREAAKLGGESAQATWVVRDYKEKTVAKDADTNELIIVEKDRKVRLCPRCGSEVVITDSKGNRLDEEDIDKKLKDSHSRCMSSLKGKSNTVAKVAVELAELLARSVPENNTVLNLFPGRYGKLFLEKRANAIKASVDRQEAEAEKKKGLGKANRERIEHDTRTIIWKHRLKSANLAIKEVRLDGYKWGGYGSEVQVTYDFGKYKLVSSVVNAIENALQRAVKANSGNSSEGSYDKLLEALVGIIASIGDSQLAIEVAERLYRFSMTVKHDVKAESGDVITTHDAQSDYGIGQNTRYHAMKLLLLVGKANYNELGSSVTRLKTIKSSNWNYFDNTFNRLRREYKYFERVEDRSMTYESAKEAVENMSHGTYYDYQDFSVNLRTGSVDWLGHETGSYAPALEALNRLIGLSEFKSSGVCGEFLFQQQPLSRNYETGYGFNLPNSRPTRGYEWDNWGWKGSLPSGSTKSKKTWRQMIEDLKTGYEIWSSAGTRDSKQRRSSGRYPLARYIQRFRKTLFDSLVADELHEYNNAVNGSAQGIAFHRLTQLGTPIIGLTGSLMGGYSSSLFSASQAMFETFRQEFPRDAKEEFIKRYGYLKVEVFKDGDDEGGDLLGYGSHSERREMSVSKIVKKGEAPGILPLFTIQYLLRYALFIHKEDMQDALPPLQELPISVRPGWDGKSEGDDAELIQRYSALQQTVMDEIKKSMFTPGKAGKLWGAMAELMSALDLCHEETGNCEIEVKDPKTGKSKKSRAYQVRYPEFKDPKTNKMVKGPLVAEMELFPNDFVTPKERALISKVKDEIEAGKNVAVSLRHTGKGGNLVRRISRLLKESIPELQSEDMVVFLDSGKVDTSTREQWINENVVAKGTRVLLANPTTVQTGLNNLVYFTTAIWYESTYNAYTYRQYNGRFHRIGQKNAVDIYSLFYRDTTQELAVELLAKKVTASLQVDGLSVQGALEAAGAVAEDGGAYIEKVSATSIGAAIYKILEGRAKVAA
jgi:hypothetical protein